MKHSFHKTLIVGASVSAAPLDRNPAKRFLRAHGNLEGALSHALSGRPGAHVLSQLRKSILEQASAVIAVDLMFWDSVFGLAEPRESQAFLKGFFNEIKRRELPIVIGNIPGIHGLQVHRDALNQAILKEADGYSRAKVLDLSGLFDKVRRDGIRVGHKLHTLTDLVPDGLHPGPIAAEAIAQEIRKVVDPTFAVEHRFGEAKSS